MITSRTADKHRNRAMEIGVDVYLGKPYQEEELLRNLREMLAWRARLKQSRTEQRARGPAKRGSTARDRDRPVLRSPRTAAAYR